jgi:hypothetical protein
VGQSERARLRELLVTYAETHPNASDTETGIVGFWIPVDVSFSIGDVAMVLDELVSDGVLTITRLPDGTPLYSVNMRAKGRPS